MFKSFVPCFKCFKWNTWDINIVCNHTSKCPMSSFWCVNNAIHGEYVMSSKALNTGLIISQQLFSQLL